MLNTISEEYLNLQKDLHLRPDYGTASIGMAPEVKKIFEENKLTSISDYGAGKCNLQKTLKELGLNDNHISNIDGLAKLTKLIELDISTNVISNIDSLAKLTKLIELKLHNNEISNIDSLANLINHVYLVW